MQIGLIPLITIAYLGGILSIASPCSGLMLPLFFANTFSKKTTLVRHTILFSLGALAFSIPLSLGFSYLLFRLNGVVNILYLLFGVVFIVFGFFLIVGKTPLSKFKLNYKFSQSWQSSFILGIVSTVSLGACSGPVLGVVLTASATIGFLGSALLMFIYVLGIITPFI
jgi:cytochrome c biogenesis protein CcdA